MPYALIPDGYTLKKVTELQKQAVNSKRKHDDVMALLNNPNGPPTIAAGALIVATPIIIKALWPLILEKLEELGYHLTDQAKSEVQQAAIDGSVSVYSTALFKLSPAAPFGALDELLTGGKTQEKFEEFLTGIITK